MVFASRGMARLLDCAAEELLGRESWSLIHGDDIRRLASMPASTRSNESGLNYRFRRVSSAGGEGVWVEAVARTVPVTTSTLYSVSLEWRLPEMAGSAAALGEAEGGAGPGAGKQEEEVAVGASSGGSAATRASTTPTPSPFHAHTAGSQATSWAEGGSGTAAFPEPHASHPARPHSNASNRPRPAKLPQLDSHHGAGSAQPMSTAASANLPSLYSTSQPLQHASGPHPQRSDAPPARTIARLGGAAFPGAEEGGAQSGGEEDMPVRRRSGPRNEAIASIEVTTGPALDGRSGRRHPSAAVDCGGSGDGSWPNSGRTSEIADHGVAGGGGARYTSSFDGAAHASHVGGEAEEGERDSRNRSGTSECVHQPLDMASPLHDAASEGSGRRVARLPVNSVGHGARPERPLGVAVAIHGNAAPVDAAGAGAGTLPEEVKRATEAGGHRDRGGLAIREGD